jgi:hypothetical protein
MHSTVICRLRGPLLLVLTGVIALLDQAGILSWGHAWPLYLILLGVLSLLERAALNRELPPRGWGPGAQYGPGPGNGQGPESGPEYGPRSAIPRPADNHPDWSR